MMSRKRIRQCLFFVELSAAIGISAFTLVLLKVLHCGSWALRLSSTFALLWIIKAAAKFFFSSETQGDDNINENLMNNNSSHDPLKVFEARERNKSIHSKQKNDEDENNSSPPKEQQSTIMMQTKQFLEEEAEGHDDTAKISFWLMSIIATVFFQLVIRLIVVTQNFRFAFRRKKMAALGNGLKSLLFNTPFTIGRSLSPSRCSFYIFSFLNNFLEGEAFQSEDDDEDDHEIMTLKAISFDHVSTNSSSIWIRPLRKHSATNHLSWFGLCFGDIDLRFTILLKRKYRHNTERSPFIQSITISTMITSLTVGLFPRVVDWVDCSDIKIKVTANVDAKSSVDVSLQSRQLRLYRTWFSSSSSLEPQVSSTYSKIFSWDNIDVFCDDGTSCCVALSIPSGFINIHSPVTTTHFRRIMSSDTLVQKKVIIHLGGGCLGNRIGAGVNLNNLRSFVQRLELLFRNIESCIDNHCTSTKETAVVTTEKTKSSMQLVELSASAYIHAYTTLSSPNESSVGHDVLSFTVPCVYLAWKITNSFQCRASKVAIQCETADDSASDLRLVSIENIRFALQHSEQNSQCVNASLGRMVVRVDADILEKLMFCMKLANRSKLACICLQKKIKQLVLSTKHASNASEIKVATRKHNNLDRIVVSVNGIDAVFELSGGSGNNVLEEDDGRVRIAIVQESATIDIARHDRGCDTGSSTIDANGADPYELFRSRLRTYGASFLIENKASRAEASVTFLPHPSLPVFEHDNSQQPKEVSFYVQVITFGLQTVNPSKTPRPQSEELNSLTKAMIITFGQVSMFERAGNRNDTMSLLATSVHKCHFSPYESWSMINSYRRIAPFHLTRIFQGTGEFCLCESGIHKNCGIERAEIISVRMKRGMNDVAIVWSPIFQWIQMSFSKRLQAALAHLRYLGVVEENQSSSLSTRCRNTNVYVRLEKNVHANMHIFVGEKSAALLAIDGGCDVSTSITKYPSLRPPVQLKPSVCIDVGHLEVFMNDIPNPILISDGFRFQDKIRRALKHEIDDYVRKKENPVSEDISNEIAADIDGCPMKEIFHLNIGAHATAILPPTLLLGEIIDDFNLLPKSLDAGMNSLKDCEQQTRVKKYQLMTIECILPSFCMSLLDVDDVEDVEETRLRDEVSLFIESCELTIERNTPPELTQVRLNKLDEDSTSEYTYGPVVQGGDIQLSVAHLMFTVHPLNVATPMVRIGNFSINGCLYLAGLCPTTPGIKQGAMIKSKLICHHRGQCCCPFGVEVFATGVPVKLYTESKLHCDELDVNYGQVMGPSMPRLQECIKRILPPPKDAPDEPLTWWDNIRFAVHGPITLCVDQLSFRWLLDSHIYHDHSIFLTCEDCTLAYKESFSLDAIHINVSMPGVPYDTSVHPSEIDATRFHLPHKTESIVGKGSHPLLFVPSLSTKMSFSWKMLNPHNQPYQHHSVYFDREDEPTQSDKFATFRSDGFFVNLSFELPGSDVVCNWIALRIDVLPWFTHINSTVDYSLLHDDDRPDPLPRFLSLAMNIRLNRLKIAAWYEEEEGAENWQKDDKDDGLCLNVRQVEYTANSDGVINITIGGPVKAARLLNISGFTQPDETEEYDMSEMDAIEAIATGFGSNLETKVCSSLKEEGNITRTFTPFSTLEKLSSDIDELDYVLTTGQIDILNQSLSGILAGSVNDTSKGGDPAYADLNLDRTTWTILVSRLKILWTLEIRDSLMAISKDLIFIAGYMKSQVRQMHVLAERETDSLPLSTTPLNVEDSFCFPQVVPVKESSRDGLQYLLRRDSSFSMNTDIPGSQRSDESRFVFEDEALTLPTLDIHFSNPQFQLHSKSTGGSVILAMEGAHVEGKKFVKFLVTSCNGPVSPADLIRKTEHIYTLQNMEAYSLNAHVDISVGLPWLEVNVPAAPIPTEKTCKTCHLEDLFGIAPPKEIELKIGSIVDEEENKSNWPPSLRHHEPFAFMVQKNIRPIMNKFTCLSRQLFHRPPIHYSNEELKSFIKQGLVTLEQRGPVVDDIDLEIDLLMFNLDSYQFKTTIDLIRNVLLEPPKPHRRSKTFVQLDMEETTTSTKRMSSLQVLEMERVLWETRAKRSSGKKERDALRSSAMSLVQDLEDRVERDGDQTIRQISYKLSKLVWFVQNQQQIDDVEIAFTGFTGSHCYMASGSVKSQISLEDVRVTSSKPGPDSLLFKDADVVVKPVLGNERSPCQRCGRTFSHSNNDLNSCQFHSGKYVVGKWTCCQASESKSPGCKTGPHTGKERTAVVRVETLPPAVEGITLYSHLEVNIFPSVPHTLIVQISKSLSRLFMDYFFIGGQNDGDNDDDVKSAMATASTKTDSTTHNQTSRKKSLLIGGKGNAHQSINEDVSGGSYDQIDHKHFKEQQPVEMFFVKVLRVGHVNVEVSLSGFKALPQTTLNLCVREYSKAYKIGSSSYLGQKYLYYLIHEIVKSGTSSALRRKKMVTSSFTDTDKSEDDLQNERKLKQTSSPRASWRSKSGVGEDSRPIGVEDIIGSPARKPVKKKKRRVFS